MNTYAAQVYHMRCAMGEWGQFTHTNRYSTLFIDILNIFFQQVMADRFECFDTHWFVQQPGIDLRMHVQVVDKMEIVESGFANHQVKLRP